MIQLPMLFPGQGSQTVGMTADLAQASGPAADFLGTVNDSLDADLLTIMHEGPAEVLTETRNAQPAIVAHSVAIVKALEARGIKPSLVAGHSVGEFAAAVAAGALTPADGLKVVRRRGELMFAAGQEIPGTMAAVLGLKGEQVTEICARVTAETGVVVLANHNSAAQVVISGEVDAVAAAGQALKEAGARRVLPLNVSGAFHSPLLEDAATRFKEFLKDIPVRDAQVPLVANVTATAVTEAGTLATGFGRQLTAPVRWHETMEALCAAEKEAPAVVLEVGPGKVLANMAKRAYPHVKFISVGTQADLDGIEGALRESL
ncbi:[acyl-carrier-protein] S-malonyltransferase [bacterium DOLZORAL124_64_63]|nr:MAG: [acyl-carrier-protein] S-malonyltransferase [bacterium DOLZORAL124_64_63]